MSIAETESGSSESGESGDGLEIHPGLPAEAMLQMGESRKLLSHVPPNAKPIGSLEITRLSIATYRHLYGYMQSVRELIAERLGVSMESNPKYFDAVSEEAFQNLIAEFMGQSGRPFAPSKDIGDKRIAFHVDVALRRHPLRTAKRS